MKSLSQHILEHMSQALETTSINAETVQESSENPASTTEANVNENKEEESED